MKKSKINSISWGWAESTDPTKISNEHIKLAYRLGLVDECKNLCRKFCFNPFCLSGLGENRLIEDINKINDKTIPELMKREPGYFVGLKNLGATCYINSLLQLLFHNQAFRNAIFAWNPMEDPEERNNSTLYSDDTFCPKTVVGHLQQLFALMLYSNCKYIDPSSLIECLRIDSSLQQDAQEFSKLFISKIESDLQHQSSTSVKHFFNNYFKGEYQYVTRCCKCETTSVSASTFYELDLTVKGHNTLSDCLTGYLKEELLEGADSYSCCVCLSKQVATRHIKLCSLPLILNLQLLRFVYDREKNQRKKLSTPVQFPETFDMGENIEGYVGEPMIYHLSAVLSHRGSSASSGHFIAYIKDEGSGNWNMFNDESVVKLEGKKLKLDEAEHEISAKKPKTSKVLKDMQSSTDAYMLVYIAEKHKQTLDQFPLSPKLKTYVDDKNNVFEEFCEDVLSSKKQDIQRQEKMLSEFNSLSVNKMFNKCDVEAIPVEWLTAWLRSKTETLQPINTAGIVCPHSLLDPFTLDSVKYVYSERVNALFEIHGGGPRLKLSETCETCVTNNCHIMRTRAQTLEHSREVQNLIRKRMGPNEPGFFVDKDCLKSWRTKVLKMVEAKYSSKKSNLVSLLDDPSESVTDESEPPSQTTSLQSLIKSENQSETLSQTTSANSLVMSEDQSGPLSQTTSTQSLISIKDESLDEKKYPVVQLRAIDLVKNNKESCVSSLRTRNLRHVFSHSTNRKRPLVTVPLSEIKDCFVMCSKLELSLNKPHESKDFNGRPNDILHQCKKLKVMLQRLTTLPSPKKSKNLKYNKRYSSERLKENVIKNSTEQLESHCDEENRASSDEVEKTSGKNEGCEKKLDAELDKEFNESLLCHHGNLTTDERKRKLVPIRVWDILKLYFPSAPEFTHLVTPCLQCQTEGNMEAATKQAFNARAINEKEALQDLLYLKNRPNPSNLAEEVFVINRQHFYTPWSNFVRKMSRREAEALVEPPSSLHTDLLLCSHGRLDYSPNYEQDLKQLTLVTRKEWETLASHYLHSTKIILRPDLTTEPELCDECFSARLENQQKERFNYTRTKLTIVSVPSSSSSAAAAAAAAAAVVQENSQEIFDTEVQQTKRIKLARSTSPVPLAYSRLDLAAGEPGQDLRRSTRSKRMHGQKVVNIMVSSTHTLRDVKQQIMNKMAIAPFDQHLLTEDGRELHGDFNTLSDLQVLPNSTLRLQVDEVSENFDLNDSFSADEVGAGFAGTGLMD